MRLLTLVLIMLSTHLMHAQVSIPLNKEWVSKNLDYIKLNETHIFFQINGFYQEKGYHIYGDTLRLQDWYHSSADNFKTLQHNDFDFLINVSENKITLKPLNKSAFQISKQSIEFEPIENTYLKEFNYKSIRFTSTTCYGECPEMTILIEGRKVSFTGGVHAIKKGRYAAVLSEDLYQNLINILQKSSFNNAQNNRIVVIDAPRYSISIENNNITKTISGESLPILINPLLNFFLDLPSVLADKLILVE